MLELSVQLLYSLLVLPSLLLEDAQPEVLFALLVRELFLQTGDLVLQGLDFSVSVGRRRRGRRRRQIRNFLLEGLLDCVLLGYEGHALNDALEAHLRPLYLFLLAVEVALNDFLLRQGRFRLIDSLNLQPRRAILMRSVVELPDLLLREVGLQDGGNLSLDPGLLVPLLDGDIEDVDDLLELIAVEDDLIKICKIVIVEHVFVLLVGKVEDLLHALLRHLVEVLVRVPLRLGVEVAQLLHGD